MSEHERIRQWAISSSLQDCFALSRAQAYALLAEYDQMQQEKESAIEIAQAQIKYR